MTCRRYRVTGRVQGVAFRHSTVVVARELGLTGWCRNLADGSVEVCACGDEATLSQLNAWLHQGQLRANRSHGALLREALLHPMNKIQRLGGTCNRHGNSPAKLCN